MFWAIVCGKCYFSFKPYLFLNDSFKYNFFFENCKNTRRAAWIGHCKVTGWTIEKEEKRNKVSLYFRPENGIIAAKTSVVWFYCAFYRIFSKKVRQYNRFLKHFYAIIRF